MFSMSWFLAPMDADVNVMAKSGLSGTNIFRMDTFSFWFPKKFVCNSVIKTNLNWNIYILAAMPLDASRGP